MKRIRLDKIDRKILRDLQDNGRITNIELSRNAGISAPPCLRRVRALEEAGFIQGYYAKLDAQALGFGLTVFAHIKLTSQAESDLKKFEEACLDMPMVRQCHMISGEVDFLLKIVANNWDAYQQFLTEELTALENVTSVKTMPLVRSSKNDPGVPVNCD